MLKTIILIFMIPTPALAYIDPGTRSIIISFLVGIIAASFFYIKGLAMARLYFWERYFTFYENNQNWNGKT